MISIKDLKVDFRLIEFEFDLFYWNDEIFLSCWNTAIIVLDITKFLVSNFGEDIFIYIWVHVDKLLANDFIDTGWATINVDVVSKQWIPFFRKIFYHHKQAWFQYNWHHWIQQYLCILLSNIMEWHNLNKITTCQFLTYWTLSLPLILTHILVCILFLK